MTNKDKLEYLTSTNQNASFEVVRERTYKSSNQRAAK